MDLRPPSTAETRHHTNTHAPDCDTLITDEGKRGREKEKGREALRNCGYLERGLEGGGAEGENQVEKETEPGTQQGSDHGEGKSSRHFALLYPT